MERESIPADTNRGLHRGIYRYAWCVLPLLLFLAFYWPALSGWFYQDDFGWLRLRLGVHSVADLPAAIFAPKAHGNMRPLGENAYWLLLGSAFGVRALPFRLVTFATQMASLLLLGAVAERLAKSRVAGFCAQVFWMANCGLAPSIGWSSIYNQVLSGFFFLLAFYFLLRHVETGRRGWWLAQWAAFVLGLGALEINVVYPALAALYALLFARPLPRPLLKKTLPLFLVSAVSIAVHFHFAPAPHTGVYALHVDGRIFGTLWTYWDWALGRMAPAMAVPLTVVALAFAARRAARRDGAAVFALAWFAITLAPYLPLPDHKMDYYLAVPSIGLALLGASAVAAAARARVPWKAVAAACLVCYLVTSGRAAWAVTRWEHDRGRRVEDFVLGVAEIRRNGPDKAILLDGMDDDLFWAAMVNLPFHAMQIPEVFLAPGAEGVRHIQAPADLLSKFVLPPSLALHTLRQGAAVVYRVKDGLLRNQTTRYREMADAEWKDEAPRFVNIGDPLFAECLGPGWGQAAEGYRPMRRTASLRIAAPRAIGENLYIGVFRTRDFVLNLTVDGATAPLALVYRDNDLSEFRAALPPAAFGRPSLELWLATDLNEPLTFGYAEIR